MQKINKHTYEVSGRTFTFDPSNKNKAVVFLPDYVDPITQSLLPIYLEFKGYYWVYADFGDSPFKVGEPINNELAEILNEVYDHFIRSLLSNDSEFESNNETNDVLQF